MIGADDCEPGIGGASCEISTFFVKVILIVK